MNKRIRELVRQSGLDDADFPIENWDNVPLAKFAELIIKECMSNLYLHGYDDARQQIKQHFGVEE